MIDKYVNKKLQKGDARRRAPVFDIPPKEKWLDLFEREEYGVRPPECNKPLNYSVVERTAFRGAVGEKVLMYYHDLPMEFHLWSPEKTDKAVKCFFLILHPSAYRAKDIWAHPEQITDYCPIDMVIKRGHAVAVIFGGTVADDDKNGKSSGIFSKINRPQTPDSWGVLSAWAWAVQKAADFVERDDRFDRRSFAVIGHSRGGKTALLAAAYDSRFALAVSSNSGNSGAAMSRGNTGETVRDIVERFPHWFCDNYRKFADNESALPFDQFMLLSLIAPRRIYVTSATRDSWADPVGELLSCRMATPYFEQTGVPGLIAPDIIAPDVNYDQGNIAYRRRSGKHELTHDDWQAIMDYFERF